MSDVLYALEMLNSLGLWNILTTAVASMGVSLLWFRRCRVTQVPVHYTHCFGTGNSLYPNVMCIEVRNLLDSPIVLSRPNVRFGRGLAAVSNAHGHTATGGYEIKFRPVESDGRIVPGNSFTSMLLRHRDAAFSYIPIDDNLCEEYYLSLFPERKPGLLRWRHAICWLDMNVAILNVDRIVSLKMRVPDNSTKPHPETPYLGSRPAARQSKT